MSFWLRLYHHGRVVVPGNEGAGVAGFSKFWLRSWIIGFVIVMGIRAGFPGEGYAAWWTTYSADHSMVLWFCTTLPLSLALYVFKEITFQVMARPGDYSWFDMSPPPLHKINMGIPTKWNVVFWAWLLFSPTLPFFTCFFRIFLGDSSACTLFPSW